MKFRVQNGKDDPGTVVEAASPEEAQHLYRVQQMNAAAPKTPETVNSGQAPLDPLRAAVAGNVNAAFSANSPSLTTFENNFTGHLGKPLTGAITAGINAVSGNGDPNSNWWDRMKSGWSAGTEGYQDVMDQKYREASTPGVNAKYGDPAFMTGDVSSALGTVAGALTLNPFEGAASWRGAAAQGGAMGGVTGAAANAQDPASAAKGALVGAATGAAVPIVGAGGGRVLGTAGRTAAAVANSPAVDAAVNRAMWTAPLNPLIALKVLAARAAAQGSRPVGNFLEDLLAGSQSGARIGLTATTPGMALSTKDNSR